MARKANTINTILDRLVLSTNDCWEYPGGSVSAGRPRIYIGGQMRFPYKVIFEAQCGPVPNGKHLHHTCFNKRCCNLAHILIVTPKEHRALHWNNPATKNAAKTHCINGHPYNEENTGIRKARGSRYCKICYNENYKRYRARLRAQIGR